MIRLSSLTFHPYSLPLESAWTTSGGARTARRGWLVRAVLDGIAGFGDCPADVPGHDGLTACAGDIDTLARRLADAPLAEALESLDGPGVASAAVECALLDAQSRLMGLSLRHRLDARAADSVAVNAAATLAGLGDALDDGFSVIKLKVGFRPVEDEIAALSALRLPPGSCLRLDANRAWDWDRAARFLDAVAGMPIDSVEEPLADPDPVRLAALQEQTPIPLALDESLTRFDPGAILANPPVRRLILKLGAVGGLRASLAFARSARRAGLDCVITSRLDSAVGVAAAAHLAAALDADGDALTHGLATSSWLAADVAQPLVVQKGRLFFAPVPGLGIAPDLPLCPCSP